MNIDIDKNYIDPPLIRIENGMVLHSHLPVVCWAFLSNVAFLHILCFNRNPNPNPNPNPVNLKAKHKEYAKKSQ